MSCEHFVCPCCKMTVSTDELGPDDILALPNVGFIFCHVQIP
jgi:hypothetical protein